jgi:catechol 2,3-dioxygenase-like lactoylglutathione lyase family enzyme
LRALKNAPKIVPELNVDDLDWSLELYTKVFGFKILYARPEDRFAYLDLDGVHLMPEEASGPGRRFRTTPLEHPYDRGMNLQISATHQKTVTTCRIKALSD